MSLGSVLVLCVGTCLASADAADVIFPWWNMTTSAPDYSSAAAMEARGAVIFTIVIICVYGLATVCLIASENIGGSESDDEKQTERYYEQLDYVEFLALKSKIKHRKSYYPAILAQAAAMKRQEIKEAEKRKAERKKQLVKQETAMALEGVLGLYEMDQMPEDTEEEDNLDYVGTLPSGEPVYVGHVPTGTPPNETSFQMDGYENLAFVKDDHVYDTPILEMRTEPELVVLAEEYGEGARPKERPLSHSEA